MKKRVLLGIVAIVLIAASGWTRGSREVAEGLQIVATTGHIGDAVARIAPEAGLTVLMGPGSDPHTYFPSTREVQLIQRADLVVWNGLELEIQMTSALQDLADRGFAVASAVPDHLLLAWEGHHDDQHHDDDHDGHHDDHDGHHDDHDGHHDDHDGHHDDHDDHHHHDHHDDHHHHHGAHDPHIWHDLDIWMIAVEAIAERIGSLDPQNAERYRGNAREYIAELQELKRYAVRRFSEVPEAERVLVTSHDAFGYLARAYGYRARGILGISTEDEAGVRDLQELARFIADNRVRAIFFETAVDLRAAQALQEAVRARGGRVNLSQEPLYSDSLGEAAPVDSFIGAYRHNVDTIVDTILGNR